MNPQLIELGRIKGSKQTNYKYNFFHLFLSLTHNFTLFCFILSLSILREDEFKVSHKPMDLLFVV